MESTINLFCIFSKMMTLYEKWIHIARKRLTAQSETPSLTLQTFTLLLDKADPSHVVTTAARGG